MDRDELLKKAAGTEAARLVEDGMNIGLGTGSTVKHCIIEIARRVTEEGLSVKGIPTSSATETLAKELGIPLTDFSQVHQLDLAIDGADEVDPELNLIKGGGGALLREKIVAYNSKKTIIVVDESKIVRQLGTTFPLPVEVTPFAIDAVRPAFEKWGCEIEVRRNDDGGFFVTDNGNYILMCRFAAIEAPEMTELQILAIPGIVETGLFIRMCDMVLIAGQNGITIREPK